MATKSSFVTYILWLFFGWFGVHHFYLGRDRQAFVWWCSFGGVFGLGWLRDFFRISDYVDDANESPAYFQYLIASMKQYSKPPTTTVRFFGEILIGALLGLTVRVAIPEEIVLDNKWIELLIVPSVIAAGVHIVANIGREACSFKVCLIGAALAAPFLWYESTSFLTVSFICAIFANWRGKSWKRGPSKKKSVCTRILILTLCGSVYMSLWASAFVNNTYVTTGDGHRVRAREAIINYFNSPAWENLKDTTDHLYKEWRQHGWDRMYEELILSIDPEGEGHAYKVLGVNTSSTEKEITTAYRKLAREFHPDKFKDEFEKKRATERFIEIKQAHETLSNIAARRAKRNKTSRKADRQDL